MLLELRIENFAIIQRLDLRLAPGLTTFTGETGAGKSILLDAIMALVGGRADAGSIRAGAERASLEAEFRIPERARAEIHAVLEREDLLDDPDTLTLGRELRLGGRTVARVNGRSVNVSLLRELGAYLVDIHGQSEHLSLLDVRQHLGLLDSFAGVEAALAVYRKTYAEFQVARRELNSLRERESDAARRADLLTYQLNEIDAAHLRPGEEDDLRLERNRLANAETLSESAEQALSYLDEGMPESPAVTDLLGQVSAALATLARLDVQQASLRDQAQSLAETAAELARDLRRYLEGIEPDPRRLEDLEDRLELIHQMKRKYGPAIENVLAYAEKTRADLDGITHAAERIAELETQMIALRTRLAEEGLALSEKRRSAAEVMGRGVEAELNDLRMPGASFKVDVRREADINGLSLPGGECVAFNDSGLDKIEFLIAPNPGEGLKPLVKIASGGETSRLMLALKKVLTDADAIPTLIFDEIDQGIGGRVGTVVGEKLWQLGRSHQVLCVTHLPQLAAYGEQQLRVRKEVTDGRTLTQVETLEGDERRDELALMMGGVSEANRAAAQETLHSAGRRMGELAAA